MSRLFIAEKPSMAAEISRCLPGSVKKKGYFQTDTGIVTWAVGHVLELAEPEFYDEKYKKWRTEDLPIFPKKWRLLVSPSCINQIETIKTLIANASEIVHAGDPDRAGQRIIDEILEYVHNTKPVYRLLLNALDEKSIMRALADLKDNKDFYPLSQSELVRSQADWLVGMNLSRMCTLTAQKKGHQGRFSVGRVKTPTVSLVVRREEEIKNFKPVNHYGIIANFEHKNAIFQATWQAGDNQTGLDSEGRLIDKELVDYLLAKFETEEKPPVILQCDKTQKKEAQRLPYSLSTLQIEAGKKFGYSPQEVLDTAQKLYENKLTSYPRSDCDFLPENQFEDAGAILANLSQINQSDLSKWASNTDTNIKSRAWNDTKITAHHAIIPTSQICDYDSLSDKEKNIYFLIAQTFIAQFYPVHIYNHTAITVGFSDEIFTVSGRVTADEGWCGLFKKTKNESVHDEDDANEAAAKELPLMEKGDLVKNLDCFIVEKITKPPARFTPGSLLEAMKNIHLFVKDTELKKQLKDVAGIGTEATRASIISKIIEEGFLQEEKKRLIPTEQAYLLMSILPDELTYPDETAKWEMAFEKIVGGNIVSDDFINEQETFVRELCKSISNTNMAQAAGISCPVCQKGILRKIKGQNGAFWGCTAHPECKASFADDKGKPLIIECPVCKKNVLRKRKSSKGDFWGCSDFPNCKATFENKNNRPVLEKNK